MSFDLFLTCFSSGTEVSINPKPILNVLASQKYKGPDQHGFYDVEFKDGTHVGFSASGLDGSELFKYCAFEIRGFSSQLVKFVFDVATAGKMVLFNAQGKDTEDSPVVILIGENREEDLPADLREQYSSILICTSAERLEQLLIPGFSGWEAYRDKIINAS